MKKFILMFALIIGAFVGVNAQKAIETPKVLDNTYLGVNVGATTPLNLKNVFPLNTTVGLTLGKNWSPIFGTEVHSGVSFGDNGYGVEGYTFVKAINTGVNTTINLTNLFLGYNPNKVFELQTVVGLAWSHLYSSDSIFDDKVKVSEDDDELTARTGLRFNWNLGKEKAWSINLEPLVLWNLTNGSNGVRNMDYVQFNKKYAQLALFAGVTYKFKTSNGTHNFKVWNVGKMNDEINSLRSELAKKPKEVVKEIVRERIVEKVVGQTKWVVFFDQGSAELSEDAKIVLGEICKNTTVDVVGHASPEGTVEFNQNLSVERAMAVASFLRDNGIRVNSINGKGELGVPKNRVVIVTSTK